MAEPSSYLQWTKPIGGEHPRIWVSNRFGNTTDFVAPTVAVLQQRIATTHAAEFADLEGYCDDHLSDSSSSLYGVSFPNDPQRVAAFAFSYLMKPTTAKNRSHGDKAVQVAGDCAADNPGSSDIKQRKWGLMMALVYDWCYPLFLLSENSVERQSVRREIGQFVSDLHAPSDEEYFWGTVHGNVCYATSMLCGILEDAQSGDSFTNDALVGFMNVMMGARDPGPAPVGVKQLGYFPLFRWFGNVDGGTHKGCGPQGYDTIQQEFYNPLFASCRTALNQSLYGTELWYRYLADWKLWHYRCDRALHKQHEGPNQAQFDKVIQAHALQAAAVETDTARRDRFQWLAAEIATNSTDRLGNESSLYQILWDRQLPAPARAPNVVSRPTLASVNGGNFSKFFSRAGKTIMRESFEDGSLSTTFVAERYLTGVHQKRHDGHFELAHNGAPIFISPGNYDSSEPFTYKAVNTSGVITPSDATGHRWTYHKRTLATSVSRIFLASEATDNIVDSFTRTNSSTTSRFGVKTGTASVVISNDGGQMFPKNPAGAGTNLFYEPGSLGDAENSAESRGGGSVGPTPVAQFRFFPYVLPGEAPIETSAYAYQVVSLTARYWSGKCTRYRRHFLWIKTGQIPGWPRPIIMIWDDILAKTGAVATFQLQAAVNPTGTASLLQFDRVAAATTFQPAKDARCFVRMLNPTTSLVKVEGYRDLQNILYPSTGTDSFDDSGSASVNGTGGIWRIEYTGTTTATKVQPDFLCLIFPRSIAATVTPTCTFLFDSTFIGATIDGIECKFRRDTAYAASVAPGSGGGGGPDTTPPPAVTNLAGIAGDARVDLQWDDNQASDLSFYRVSRATRVAGVYGAWAEITTIGGAPPVSEYADMTAVNFQTYRYKVAAVDTSDNESADSNFASGLNPFAPVTVTGTVPWRGDRPFSKFRDNQQG